MPCNSFKLLAKGLSQWLNGNVALILALLGKYYLAVDESIESIVLANAYMIITDESVKVLLGKGMEFKFADVEDFFLLGYPLSSSVIGIHYKEGVQQRKMEEASKAGRIVRKFNEKTAGAQEGVPASGLTVRPKVLCRMLNERLEQYRQRQEKPKKV